MTTHVLYHEGAGGKPSHADRIHFSKKIKTLFFLIARRMTHFLLDKLCCGVIFASAYFILSKKAFNPLADVSKDSIRDIMYNEWIFTYQCIEGRKPKLAFCLSRPIDAARINHISCKDSPSNSRGASFKIKQNHYIPNFGICLNKYVFNNVFKGRTHENGIA